MSVRLQRRKILAIFLTFAAVYIVFLVWLHTDEPAIQDGDQLRRGSKTQQNVAKDIAALRQITRPYVKYVNRNYTTQLLEKQIDQEKETVDVSYPDTPSFRENELQLNSTTPFVIQNIRLEPLLAGLPNSQQKEDAEDEVIWRQQQAQRLEIMRQACKSWKVIDKNLIKWLRSNHVYLENILVSDKYRTLYCYVPKAACTNWKRAFLILNDMVEDANEARLQAHKQKQTLNRYSEEDALFRIKNYTSFIFVRDPLSRVLSTFREKFSPERRGRKQWTKNLGNALYFHYGNHTWHKPLPVNGYNVSFQEFIRYLGDRHARFDLPGSEHWKPMSDICHPCQMNYSAIGKFETFDFDVKQVLRGMGREDLQHVVLQKSDHSTGSSSKALLREYYSKLTKSDMNGFSWRYRRDNQIFGYTPFMF